MAEKGYRLHVCRECVGVGQYRCGGWFDGPNTVQWSSQSWVSRWATASLYGVGDYPFVRRLRTGA